MADENGNEKSRLDRVARDLNRTLLHGSRPVTGGIGSPSARVAGQQVRADPPTDDKAGMKFNFTRGTEQKTVLVLPDDVKKTNAALLTVRATDDYFKLAIDKSIPHWILHQRESPLPDNPLPEDIVSLGTQIVQHLPPSVLQETHRLGDCQVSLWQYDATVQKGTRLETDSWQPAILLRFQLKFTVESKPDTGDSIGPSVFEILGTPQGERYYLDQLWSPSR